MDTLIVLDKLTKYSTPTILIGYKPRYRVFI